MYVNRDIRTVLSQRKYQVWARVSAIKAKYAPDTITDSKGKACKVRDYPVWVIIATVPTYKMARNIQRQAIIKDEWKQQ